MPPPPPSFSHLPVQPPLKPSPKLPSCSPTPTQDDAMYPPFPDHVNLREFYWPNYLSPLFNQIRKVVANYPMCLYKHEDEDLISYKERILDICHQIDKICFKKVTEWRAEFREKKGLSHLEAEQQIGKLSKVIISGAFYLVSFYIDLNYHVVYYHYMLHTEMVPRVPFPWLPHTEELVKNFCFRDYEIDEMVSEPPFLW
jgi:hypothetical protein